MAVVDRLRSTLAEAKADREAARALSNIGGGGTYDGMEPWQPAIDKLDGRIDSHLKWVLVAFASGFLALGGLIINRTDALGMKIDAVAGQVSSTNERVARIEGRLDINAAKPAAKP